MSLNSRLPTRMMYVALKPGLPIGDVIGIYPTKGEAMDACYYSTEEVIVWDKDTKTFPFAGGSDHYFYQISRVEMELP